MSKGFTLLEMLISITVSSLLLTTMTFFFVRQNQDHAQRLRERHSEQRERDLILTVKDDLRFFVPQIPLLEASDQEVGFGVEYQEGVRLVIYYLRGQEFGDDHVVTLFRHEKEWTGGSRLNLWDGWEEWINVKVDQPLVEIEGRLEFLVISEYLEKKKRVTSVKWALTPKASELLEVRELFLRK